MWTIRQWIWKRYVITHELDQSLPTVVGNFKDIRVTACRCDAGSSRSVRTNPSVSWWVLGWRRQTKILHCDSVTVWSEKRYEIPAGGFPRLQIIGMLLHAIRSMCIKLHKNTCCSWETDCCDWTGMLGHWIIRKFLKLYFCIVLVVTHNNGT